MFDDYVDPLQEHLDHVAGQCSNESQLAYQNSQRNVQYPNDRAKIDAIVAAGRFAVVRRYAVSCPSTDAYLATATVYVSDHTTREEALKAYEPLATEDDSDFYHEIQPFERRPMYVSLSEPLDPATDLNDVTF